MKNPSEVTLGCLVPRPRARAVCNKIRRHSDVDVRLPHVDVRLSDVDVKAHVDVKSQDVDVEPRRRDVDVEVTATCSLVPRLLFTERENFSGGREKCGLETRLGDVKGLTSTWK